MSIPKEICIKNRIQRITETVDRKVDHMDEGTLEFYTKINMKEYYLNTASEEEVDKFLKENEYLPFCRSIKEEYD